MQEGWTVLLFPGCVLQRYHRHLFCLNLHDSSFLIFMCDPLCNHKRSSLHCRMHSLPFCLLISSYSSATSNSSVVACRSQSQANLDKSQKRSFHA